MTIDKRAGTAPGECGADLPAEGVALIDADPESEEGKLLWLFPPKFARKSK